jgi:hypothetical protein
MKTIALGSLRRCRIQLTCRPPNDVLLVQVELVGAAFDCIHRFSNYLSTCPEEARGIAFKASSLEDFGTIA